MADHQGGGGGPRDYTSPEAIAAGRTRPAVCLPPDETLVAIYLRDLIAEVRRLVGQARATVGAPIEVELKAPGARLKRVTLHVPQGKDRPVVVDVRREER
jgi:hypothetical protein